MRIILVIALINLNRGSKNVEEGSSGTVDTRPLHIGVKNGSFSEIYCYYRVCTSFCLLEIILER